MNIKEKNCIFGDDHKADVSFMFVVTTIGQKPRKQRALKSVPVCMKHVAQLSPLLTSDAEKPTLDSLDTLCEAKRVTEARRDKLNVGDLAIAAASTVANAMNHRRWHILKVPHKKGAKNAVSQD